jgi:response regulator RpfG family c-di-GMP phosphodiesterase
MVCDRPHRSRLPVSEALGEFRRCSGSQFDPRVAEALCAEVALRFGEERAPAGVN